MAKKQLPEAVVLAISEREVRSVLDNEEYILVLKLDESQGDAGNRLYIQDRHNSENCVAIPVAALRELQNALEALYRAAT